MRLTKNPGAVRRLQEGMGVPLNLLHKGEGPWQLQRLDRCECCVDASQALLP